MGNSEGVGLDYWLKWQVPVCGLIIAIPAAISINLIKKRLIIAEPLNFEDFWLPCWRNLHPRWLLLYRALSFVSTAWLLYQMVLFSGLFAFYFYTQWTFALVMVYFAVGSIISAQGCLMSSKKAQSEIGEKDTFLKKGSEQKISPAISGSKTTDRNGANLHSLITMTKPLRKQEY